MPRVTEHQRQQVRDLHAQGLPRNEIARRVGISNDSVSKICRAAGLGFDRAGTEAATKAKQIDHKARRTAIISRLYAQSEKILDRLESPGGYKTIAKGERGRDVEVSLDFIPPGDRRNELTSIAISLDKAVALERVDTDNGNGHAISMLDKLAAQLEGITFEPGSSFPEATPLPQDKQPQGEHPGRGDPVG